MNKNILEKKDKIRKVPSNENFKEIEGVSPLSNNSLKLDPEQDEYEDDLEIIKIEDEEELMNKRNRINFKKIDNNDDDFIKRTVTEGELKIHSPTIASKSTAVSIYDELNNKAEEARSTISIDVNTKSKVNEITPYYSDEFETEGVNIFRRKNTIVHISFNLFLKKIIVGNFFDEYFDYTINFTEQCFFFFEKRNCFQKSNKLL